jgi:hypothetical protein
MWRVTGVSHKGPTAYHNLGGYRWRWLAVLQAFICKAWFRNGTVSVTHH